MKYDIYYTSIGGRMTYGRRCATEEEARETVRQYNAAGLRPVMAHKVKTESADTFLQRWEELQARQAERPEEPQPPPPMEPEPEQEPQPERATAANWIACILLTACTFIPIIAAAIAAAMK